MIIDAMTTAHRNEYFRNLLEHQRLTLESVTEQRDRALTKIENQAERIKYLEGATNHATGTPLTKMREQRDRLAEALWSMLNQDDMSAIRAGILLRSLGLQSPTNPNEL